MKPYFSRSVWFVSLGCSLLVGAAGCGGPALHQVKGQVVYKNGADASVLAGGMVAFDPADDDMPKISARTVIEKDGSFVMDTPVDGKGVRPGKYRVIVTPPPFFGKGRDGQLAPPLLDEKFMDFKTSGVEITVTGPVSDFTITVYKPQP